jgi:hypothetical protein
MVKDKDPDAVRVYGKYMKVEHPSEQRKAAKSFAALTGGEIKNFHSKDIHVEFLTVTKGEYDPGIRMRIPILSNNRTYFDKNGNKLSTPEPEGPTWEDKLTDIFYDGWYGNDKKVDIAINVIDKTGKTIQAAGVIATYIAPPVGVEIYEAGAGISTGAMGLKAVSAYADERYFEAAVDVLTIGISSTTDNLSNKLSSTSEKVGAKILTDRSLDKLNEAVTAE